MKKIFTLLLVCCIFSTNITANAATTVVHYLHGNFTEYGVPELIYLTEDIDMVTFIGHCANEGETDTVICHIVDKDHDGNYNASFIFEADGTATLYEHFLPSGEYRIYFTAASNTIVKKRVTVDFATY